MLLVAATAHAGVLDEFAVLGHEPTSAATIRIVIAGLAYVLTGRHRGD